jgi:hypothetical protein
VDSHTNNNSHQYGQTPFVSVCEFTDDLSRCNTNKASHRSRAAAVLVRVVSLPVLQHCAVAVSPKKDARHALTAPVCPQSVQLNSAIANSPARMLRRMLLNAHTQASFTQNTSMQDQRGHHKGSQGTHKLMVFGGTAVIWVLPVPQRKLDFFCSFHGLDTVMKILLFGSGCFPWNIGSSH